MPAFVWSRADEPMAGVPKMARGKISLARDIHCCPNFFFFVFLPHQRLYTVKKMCIYIHIYIYISECVETVYELPLLPNKSARVAFVHKSGYVRSIDWIFITGVPA
jgi:hypothetical protein